MNLERFYERFADYRKAIARLKDALDKPIDEFIRDAVIQRFEFSYELAWKTVQLYLELPNATIRSPRDAFRESLRYGIIEDGNGWSLLHEKRNLTSHTYDESLAQEVFAFVRDKGVPLFEALEREIQRRLNSGEI